jgi:hypothetical protein
MFDSIQKCRLRTGSRMRFGLLASRAPILFEASGECLFLLGGLELRQQERMADADLLAVERIHDDSALARSTHNINRRKYVDR